MFRRFRRKRRFGGFRKGRPVARIRRTWITAFNTGNAEQCEDLLSVGPTENNACQAMAEAALLGASLLQDKFSDRATVVRLVGRIYWSSPAFQPNAVTGALELCPPVEARIGLRKGNVLENITADPFNDDMLSESQWKHIWSSMSGMQGVLGTSTCPNVTGSIASISGGGGVLLDGSGTISSNSGGGGTIQTDCGETPVAGAQVTQIHPVAIDFRGRVPLRENEFLSMVLAFQGVPVAGTQAFTQGLNVDVWGHLRCLVQF